MVAIGEHDHGDGQVCPGCQFRERLAVALTRSHEAGREEWHWAVGDLRRHMHAALLALDAIEAEPYSDDDPDDDPADDAADAITAMGAEIHQLWAALMNDEIGGKEG